MGVAYYKIRGSGGIGMRSLLVEPSPDAYIDRLLQHIAATGLVSWNDLNTLIRHVQTLRGTNRPS